MTTTVFLDPYLQVAKNKGVKATKVSALIAKTVSQLSHAEQVKLLDSNDAESLEKIFVSAYENKFFDVCRTIKEIIDKHFQKASLSNLHTNGF
jgi:hypothetical protein